MLTMPGRIGLVLAAVFVIGCTPNRSATPPVTTAPGATPGPTVRSTEGPGSPAPTPANPGASDAETALALAVEFETARAGGDWPHAWALLAEDMRTQLGTLGDFAAAQLAYNDAGGRTFSIQPPTQDPDLLANFVSPAVAQATQANRGFLIFIEHPNVAGASAGSEGLFVAPLVSGDWAIWVVH